MADQTDGVLDSETRSKSRTRSKSPSPKEDTKEERSLFQAILEESAAKPLGCLNRAWTFSINPYSPGRTLWDMFTLLLVIWSAFYWPLKIAFLSEKVFLWEWLIDICFYADIVLNFWTGYDCGYEIVIDKALIAKHYLSGWFPIDIVATVQWDMLVAFAFQIGKDSDSLVYIRLCRLLKVARIARASRLIQRLTASWTIHTGFVEAGKFFVYVLIVAHLLACFFFMTPTLVQCDKPGDVSMKNCIQNSWREYYQMTSVCGRGCCDSNFGEADGCSPAFGATRSCCEVLLAEGGPRGKNELNNELLISLQKRGFCMENATIDEPVTSCHQIELIGPTNQYVQSMYWALTTMTTIGYGDRGPQLEDEIIFTMFAEVIGLSFFALLLTQINNLNDVIGEEMAAVNMEKNRIVQYMKHNRLEPNLINRVVQFLNFRAKSNAGIEFDENSAVFAPLSVSLKRQIRIALYKPILKRCNIFGWAENVLNEEANMQRVFNSYDTEATGTIDRDDLKSLISSLIDSVTTEQLDSALDEMDGDHDGEIDCVEFQAWWFVNKFGHPKMPKAPELFLDTLACCCKKRAASPGDIVVDPGEYGLNLYIVIGGEMTLKKGLGEEKRVSADDQNNIFGVSAVLGKTSFMAACAGTHAWSVRCDSFSDLVYIQRSALLEALEQTWGAGREALQLLAEFEYEMLQGCGESKARDASSWKALLLQNQVKAIDTKLAAVENQLAAALSKVSKYQ